MAITKITVTNDDGSTQDFLPTQTTATVTEVDVVFSDGTVKKAPIQ